MNLKVGQELAHGIEEAEAVLHHTKKVGEKAKQSVDKTRHATQDSKSAGKSVGATVEEEARRFGEQLQQEKETKMAHVRERAGEVKQAGEETLSEGVDRVEDAIQDTSEKLGAEESKESNQAKHRLEDEVEDAVQRLQHKRDWSHYISYSLSPSAINKSKVFLECRVKNRCLNCVTFFWGDIIVFSLAQQWVCFAKKVDSAPCNTGLSCV